MNASSKFKILTYEQTAKLLSRYQIPVAQGEVAKSPDEAITIAKKIGFPVALKVLSPQIVHKTDVKALKLNVVTESQLIECFDEIIRNTKNFDHTAEIYGVLVQKMIPDGVEVIVGVSRDPQFGPVVLFGSGGILVELLKDVALRVPPLTRLDAEEMIKETRGYKLLTGFRGKPESDLDALVNILLKVSEMSIELKNSLIEMDLNPVFVLEKGKGASVVDARVVVSNEFENRI